MRLYEEYGLSQYDGKAVMGKVKLTAKVLDAHIAAAYRYAHAYCAYGRTDTHYPPGDTGIIDCVGLVFRALYTTGWFPGMANIDQVVALLEAAGLQKSTDEGDVWRRRGVACYQDNHLKGTAHVSHVFYSLGGTGPLDISKYDLGSGKRIRADQPFHHVAANEWQGERHFLCFYYVPEEEQREAVSPFSFLGEALGKAVKPAGVYAGPGTAWKKLGSLKEGADVVLRGYVTNDKGNVWMAIRTASGVEGFVYSSSISKVKPYEVWKGRVEGTDGALSLRIAPGALKVADIPEGALLSIDGESGDWLHVKAGKKLWGFVSSLYVKKKD